MTSVDGPVARIEAATPAGRERGVDALRALAILGVVLGHWLVTALVLDGGAALRVASPLAHMPQLAPVSWALQPLAVFFFVGGYGAARRHGPYGPWLRRRVERLWRPTAVLLLAWVPLGLAIAAAGFSAGTLTTLVISPLWFLAVYALLTALTPAVVATWRRFGALAVGLPFTVVLLVDLVRFGLGGPARLGWLNVVAGWLVPYGLGIGWARGALPDRLQAVGLLTGGVLATAALVAFAGYPASMVGVPGAAVSNLNPPTLAAVTFGVAQVGLALLAHEPLSRALRRPRAWAAVALANLSAMTIFVWHQTALIAVTVVASAFGSLPGLHDQPTRPGWILDRLVWLPVFAAVLACLGFAVRAAAGPWPPRCAALRRAWGCRASGRTG